MRYILLVFLVVFVSEAVSKKDWKKSLVKMQEKCRNESGMDKEALEKLKKSRVVDESDEKVLKFIYCLAVDNNFIDKKGNLKSDIFRKHLKDVGVKEETTNKAIEECDKIEKPERVLLLTIRYYECYAKYLPAEVLIM
ncbi:uncharacterized protein LOC123307907 [Coccinella septempunctata]|uniref:uncharacterized protein LOC123307907 n=1 Tax=Coccinella septempunctata TaxID=41139 RepID=UPI001D05C50B|nr:uncharacterized protein LOC123307907 [Coccinella septempunctata]